VNRTWRPYGTGVTTDELVPEPLLAELRQNPAVMFARPVQFRV